MVEIEFNYNQVLINIQAKLDDPFQDVINKFMQKSLLDPGSVNFLTNGKVINPNETVENHMSNLNKEKKKMNIIVTMIDQDYKNKEQVMVKSKDIICPKCKEPCRITFENYKIKLYECINDHVTENIKFIVFDNTQNINEFQIKCERCPFKNKGNCPDDEFFRCLNCKLNLCLLCKPNHDPRHNIIKYEQKNYICQTHYDSFMKYCIQCKKNICFACEGHENHEFEDLGNLKPNIEEKKKILNELKINIDAINKTIKEVIDKLNGFMLYISKFYEINNNILENYDVKRRNFQSLKNINEINDNNEIIEIIKKINNNNTLKDKISDILDLYKDMNKDQNIMTIIYNINKDNKIKLFDNYFVNKNKNNCYLIIDNIEQELTDYIKIKTKEQKKLEIKLFETHTITSMFCIFYKCTSLSSLPDISKWDTKNVTNMNKMFSLCSSLVNLNLSNFNTKNVTNMSKMFSECESLTNLNLSNFNTENVTDMGWMFNECKSLANLNLSNFNTENVTNMSYMFHECKSLTNVNLSNFNTQNVTNMSNMFGYCISLLNIDLSNFNTKNVTNMSYMFFSCKSLKNINLSNFNTKNVTNMSDMFYGCVSLTNLNF